MGLIILACWGLSEDKKRFPFLLTLGAIALQAGIVALFFASPWAAIGLQAANGGMESLTQAAQAGTRFVFGYLGGGEQPFPVARPQGLFVFAFQVLPIVLVVSALSALLWHLGILGALIRAFGVIFQRTLGLGGASALAVSANIFLGMVETPLVIRGYLDRLTRSELFLLMTVGLSTVAGSTMAAYAAMLGPSLPGAAGHVLAASIMTAPAGVLLARVMIPEAPGEGGVAATYDSQLRYEGVMDALLKGVSDGLTIALNVGAMLLVLVALVALADSLLGAMPNVLGAPLSIGRVLGWLFWPLAWAMGITPADLGTAARLLGTKMALTEFAAYLDLAAIPVQDIAPRTRVILTYGLCGFANLGSVGIMAAGLVTLLPQRRAEVLELCWKSLLPGFLASCLTGSVVAALPSAIYAMG